MNQLKNKVIEWVISRLSGKARTLVPRYGFYAWACLGLRGIPVVLLRGPTLQSGQMGTLLVAGHDPWVGYLPSRFFFGEPQRELVGNVSLRKLPALLDRLRASADLTIVRADRLSAQKFFGKDYLAVPEWVRMGFAVPSDLDGLVRGKRSIREDMRLARRHKLYPLVTEGDERFDEFYESMYAPFSHVRHGAMAIIRGRQELRRSSRKGGILWIMRDNQSLAGMLFVRNKDILDMQALGIVKEELPLKMRGIMAALYYHSIAHARQLGCAEVNFGAARSSLHDGLLRYKRKWGDALCDNPHSYYDLLIRWNSVNGVVKDFFSHTGLIFRDEERLSAIYADESQSCQSLWIGGLHRLYLLTESGRQLMHDEKGATNTVNIHQLENEDVFCLNPDTHSTGVV
ncbi:MAG: hypothetical protein MRJ67_07810 [Nitrospirales bacterium]|nr:hypothetical protein [Nitrospirales bacterium]